MKFRTLTSFITPLSPSCEIIYGRALHIVDILNYNLKTKLGTIVRLYWNNIYWHCYITKFHYFNFKIDGINCLFILTLTIFSCNIWREAVDKARWECSSMVSSSGAPPLVLLLLFELLILYSIFRVLMFFFCCFPL